MFALNKLQAALRQVDFWLTAGFGKHLAQQQDQGLADMPAA
jgi:hypothetical protein